MGISHQQLLLHGQQHCKGTCPSDSMTNRSLTVAALIGQSPSIDVVCADAADYLTQCPPGSFEAFSLSNILDGASEAYARRLWRAVRRAAAPGAVIVLRSLGEPATVEADEWAAADRSMIWGAVMVLRSTHRGFVAVPLPYGRGSDRLRHSVRRRRISRAVAARGPRDAESSLLQVS